MDVTPSAQAAAFWAGLLLLLMLVLSALVVRQRRRLRVALGDQGDPELTQAVRAFGNASEYIPAGLAALGVLILVGASPGLIHTIGAILFIGRFTHAVGLLRSGGASAARSIGVMLTWLAYLLAAISLLFFAIP